MPSTGWSGAAPTWGSLMGGAEGIGLKGGLTESQGGAQLVSTQQVGFALHLKRCFGAQGAAQTGALGVEHVGAQTGAQGLAQTGAQGAGQGLAQTGAQKGVAWHGAWTWHCS